MRPKFTTVFTVIGVATVLVLAGNTITEAATGHGFLLGKSNSANKVTTLTRTTGGSVLSLHSKTSAYSPLTVNGRGKVTNLNADLVDGLDSSTLKTTPYVFKLSLPQASASNAFNQAIPVPNGTYELTYSALLLGATGNVGCYFEQPGPTVPTSTYAGEDEFTVGTQPPGLVGTAVLTKIPGGNLYLFCESAHAFFTLDNQPIQIIATRLDGIAGSASLRTVH